MTFGLSPYFIQGSAWAVENIIETPMDSFLTDPIVSYMNTFTLTFRLVFQLERLFVKKKGRKSR